MSDDPAEHGDRETTVLFPTVSTALRASAPNPQVVVPRLVQLEGEGPGRRYLLRSPASIGRDAESTVCIQDPMASRHHAILRRLDPRGSEWEIEDLASRNGTFLNDARILRHTLRFGDRIRIGQTVLLFTFVDPLEEALVHRKNLDTIGRVGASIAHDMNNLLGGILINVDFLLGALGSSAPELATALEEIRAGARLGKEITSRILRLAGADSDSAQLDLGAIVRGAMHAAKPALGAAVRVEQELAPDVHVRGRRSQLEQLVTNLLVNASDAMPRGGRVVVRLSHRPSSGLAASVVAGELAELVVEDEGEGIDPAIERQIYDPFFTTRGASGHVGLGLTIARDVATEHGGTLEHQRRSPRGTRFRLVLPALTAGKRVEARTPIGGAPRSAELRRPEAGAARTSSPGDVRVLVVDDEPLVRRGLERLLRSFGYRVTVAGGGDEGLELFHASLAGRSYDVVLLDLDMPDRDGLSVLRAMRAEAPHVVVIFLTGYATEARQRELVDAGAKLVVAKPCDAATLRRAIERVLEA